MARKGQYAGLGSTVAPPAASSLEHLDRELVEVLGDAPDEAMVGVEHEYVVRESGEPANTKSLSI